MRQGGEPQGVQVVRQGEPTPYHCDFNSLYLALFGLSAMHNDSTAFGMALSAVLLGCLAQFAALLYFFAPANNI